jgi:tripartite-type tricarboxylate transporter receptor subunit TctC
VVVNPSFPAKTVPEFIAYAKAHPGQINMASTGTGNLTQFAGELFKMMAGVDMVHVPYGGEMQAQAELLSGRAQVMFDPIISSIEYIKAGKLRALAVATAGRLDTLPGIPTLGEFVPGYAVSGRSGVGAPNGTPADVISKLNTEIAAGLADPKLKTRLTELGGVPVSMSPSDYGKFVADETEKWTKVVKFAVVKPE